MKIFQAHKYTTTEKRKSILDPKDEMVFSLCHSCPMCSSWVSSMQHGEQHLCQYCFHYIWLAGAAMIVWHHKKARPTNAEINAEVERQVSG